MDKKCENKYNKKVGTKANRNAGARRGNVSDTVKLCHRCGGAWISEQRFPGRTETCAQCGYDLHCCLNCKLYTPGKPNDCATPTIELVLDKEKANFCGEFDFAKGRAPQKQDKAGQQSKDAWDKLFGD